MILKSIPNFPKVLEIWKLKQIVLKSRFLVSLLSDSEQFNE